jgi:hypothetical protein
MAEDAGLDERITTRAANAAAPQDKRPEGDGAAGDHQIRPQRPAGLTALDERVDQQPNFDEVHTFYQRLPADRFPVLASIAEEMTGPDDVERFEFGLTALISGFEAMSRVV